MARRFFAGDDAGTWKFRISKPGFDAKMLAAGSTNLQIDGAWDGALPIHDIISVVSPGSSVSSFSVSWTTLPFIPHVHLLRDLSAYYAANYAYQFYGRDFRTGSGQAYTEITESGATFKGYAGNVPASSDLGLLFVFAVPSA